MNYTPSVTPVFYSLPVYNDKLDDNLDAEQKQYDDIQNKLNFPYIVLNEFYSISNTHVVYTIGL